MAILQQLHFSTVCSRPSPQNLVTLAARAGSINPLGEELNDSRFEVVHRACNLDAAGGFEIPKHRAPLRERWR